MRIGIVGAGAIGGTYAWFLARAGHEVALLDIRGDHVEAVRADGLVALLPDGSEEAVAVAISSVGAELAPAPIVMVATKAYSTEDAVRGAAGLVGPETILTTVQNGLGNDRAIARVVGEARVAPGSTTVAAEGRPPGKVLVGASVLGGHSHTVVGKPRGVAEIPVAVSDFAAALSGAGLPAEVVESADLVIWRKLVLAGSMGPLSAALQMTVAGVMENPPARALLFRLVDEIAAVATATGVPLDATECRTLCENTFGPLGHHRASMTVDVAEGRRTEIDAMCVEVACLGREHGVPAPVNEVVGEMIRALEAR